MPRVIFPIPILFILSVIRVNGQIHGPDRLTYRVAVVDYAPIPFIEGATEMELMLANAGKYSEYAERAKNEHADLIIFPEYGLMGFDYPENQTIPPRQRYWPYMQYVPDPNKVSWNPCSEPDRFDNNSKVMQQLSCAARNNNIVLLANLLTYDPCTKETNPSCPDGNQFQFNTNVIFSKNGSLIARYHKHFLFAEDDFLDFPDPAEIVIIDLGFAKFGTFTCFDIQSYSPTVELVEKYGIRNLLFSTAWASELPFLTAPQLFSSMAYGLGVNLIVSNMYNPPHSRLGSGIYSSNLGPLNQTWDLATPGRLIVADVPIVPNDAPPIKNNGTCAQSDSSEEPESPTMDTSETEALTINSSFVVTNIPSSSPSDIPTHKIWYQSLKNFSFLQLDQQNGSGKICQPGIGDNGKFCCGVSYSYSTMPENEIYVLAVRNGPHHFLNYRLGFQACAVFRCEYKNVETCGRVFKRPAKARFSSLEIKGDFNTKLLYPHLYRADLQLISNNRWNYTYAEFCKAKSEGSKGKSRARIITNNIQNEPLMVAAIYGKLLDLNETIQYI